MSVAAASARRLVLLRHAKAVPAEAPLADANRPLSERGELDAQRIGERLRHHALVPELMLASPAVRTAQTAAIVADCVAYPRASVTLDSRLYLAEPADILEVVAGVDDTVTSLFVVGHNPGITELAHRLLADFDVDDLPTAAVVAFDYSNVSRWSDVDSAQPELRYYDFPRNARAPFTTR